MSANVDQASINAVASQVESMISSNGAGASGSATASLSSGVLKDLVSELSQDGKLDKGELNILKLFLELLKSLDSG